MSADFIGFYKYGEVAISILVFLWMLYKVTSLLRWRRLMSFNVVRRSISFYQSFPKTATTKDRRLKVRELVERVGILKDRVGLILHEILDMRKLSAR